VKEIAERIEAQHNRMSLDIRMQVRQQKEMRPFGEGHLEKSFDEVSDWLKSQAARGADRLQMRLGRCGRRRPPADLLAAVLDRRRGAGAKVKVKPDQHGGQASPLVRGGDRRRRLGCPVCFSPRRGTAALIVPRPPPARKSAEIKQVIKSRRAGPGLMAT